MQASGSVDGGGVTPHGGDMARRVVRRRTELGKSVEEVATKVGVDPGYLHYFEENAGVRLSTGTVLLLALALECRPEDLTGGRVERPSGHGRAGRRPELRTLSREQCTVHLQAGGVGRLVFVSERGPVAHPVNYVLDHGDVVVATTVAQAASLVAQDRVSFEVDRVDAALSEGWSVLVTGPARRVIDAADAAALEEAGPRPWAGGERHERVRVQAEEVTGRVIVTLGEPSG